MTFMTFMISFTSFVYISMVPAAQPLTVQYDDSERAWSRNHIAWGGILNPLQKTLVALGKLLTLSVQQFSRQECEGGLNELTHAKCLKQCLTPVKYLTKYLTRLLLNPKPPGGELLPSVVGSVCLSQSVILTAIIKHHFNHFIHVTNLLYSSQQLFDVGIIIISITYKKTGAI